MAHLQETAMSNSLIFRNSQGELVDVPAVAATRLKNEFGAVLEQAVRGGAVAITRHDTPRAVLISYEEFQALVKARSPSLDDLSAEYDVLLARMQTAKAKKGMEAAFNATPAELGRAAVKAARKRVPKS
jgi:prevent-host-death family protein